MTNTLNSSRLESLLNQEAQLFYKNHPRSYELYQRARKSLHGGVPMLWMIRWAGSFPVFVKEARGAHFTDVDGNSYIDFCLGDTGAMTGHSPDATVKAITEQIQKGITLMLPYIVKRLGNRSEYWFTRTPPRNGGEAHAAVNPELDRYMHLFELNRGILMTPFHNMALLSPDISQADVDYHTRVFREAVES